jgi:hypothetical protein
LAFGGFAGFALPFFIKGDGAMADFVPRKRHAAQCRHREICSQARHGAERSGRGILRTSLIHPFICGYLLPRLSVAGVVAAVTAAVETAEASGPSPRRSWLRPRRRDGRRLPGSFWAGLHCPTRIFRIDCRATAPVADSITAASEALALQKLTKG